MSLEQELSLTQGLMPNPAIQNCNEFCQTDDSTTSVDDMLIAALLLELDFFAALACPAAGTGGSSSSQKNKTPNLISIKPKPDFDLNPETLP